MIDLCVEFRTVAPLEPLSWCDLIYLEEFRKEDSRSRDLILQDIRSVLVRLLQSWGGSAENLPSDIFRMAKRYERLQQ